MEAVTRLDATKVGLLSVLELQRLHLQSDAGLFDSSVHQVLLRVYAVH